MRRAVVGMLSPGLSRELIRATAENLSGFSVTMKSAWPVSAHAQKGSCPGSGEMFGRAEAGTRSAPARSRLIIFPMSGRRTPSLPKTRLYSRRISSLPDKRIPFDPARSRLALGFLGAISVDLSPAIPATRADVSTTPLGRFLFFAGNGGDLRQLLSSRAVLTNGF